MSKIYTTDGKLLIGNDFPKIEIANKLIPVDNRQKTFIKIQAVLKEAEKTGNDFYHDVFVLAFGKEHTKEIEDLDLSVQATENLLIYTLAAIRGLEYETVKNEFFRS